MPITRSLLAFLLFASPGLGAELRTLSGKVLIGEVFKLTDKEVTLGGPNGRSVTPIRDVLAIDFQRESVLPAGKYTDVELTNGSLLHCSRLTFKGTEVELKLALSEQTIKVPLVALSYVLNDADDSANRQEWDKILAKKGNQDILAVKLNGVINGLEGTLGEVNEKGEIAFARQSGGRKREIDPARVQGMIFQRSPDPDAPVSVCKIQDVYRNLYVASKVESRSTALAITTAAGGRIELPQASISRLDFNSDKVVYLSELTKPQENVHVDQGPDNVEIGPIKIEGRTFTKGLAVHSPKELVYAIDGKYRRLEAILAMDDMVRDNSRRLDWLRPPTALVKIEGDGNELFSATVLPATASQKLDIDIKGVKQLRIVVTSNGITKFGDHVDLAEAKLSK
jgi:hypothetical protein